MNRISTHTTTAALLAALAALNGQAARADAATQQGPTLPEPMHLSLIASDSTNRSRYDRDLTFVSGQAPSSVGTVKIYWENDGAFHDPTDGYDRHYTSGFAVVLDHQPQWAEDLAAYMPLGELFAKNHGEVKTGAGYLLSQLIFTPNNLASAAPIPGDQPYAGYLYGGAFWQREGQYDRRDDIAVLDHFELNVGVVGEDSLAEDIQDWVHDEIDADSVIPRGWDNQLANEVTVQGFYRRKWRVDLGAFQAPLLGPLDMQVIPQAGVALGTVYRHADAAATFRIGQQLPDDFGPGRINDLHSTTGDPFAFDGWSWYVFTRVGGKLVEHDLFLDGSNSDPSLSVSKNSAVGEVQGGFNIGYRPNANHRFDLSWGVTYHTDTFDGPGATGSNSYGTIMLGWFVSF